MCCFLVNQRGAQRDQLCATQPQPSSQDRTAGSRWPGFFLRPLSLPAEIQGGQYLISPAGEEEGSSVHVSDFLDQKGKFFVGSVFSISN